MITAVVLAGGSSSRMGREKALTPLAGKPLVIHVAESFRGFADEIIVSVGPGMSDKYDGILPSDIRALEDSALHTGPVEGMHRSIQKASGDWIAVCPCDTPFLDIGVYSLLLDRAHGFEGAAAIIRGYVEPLHVILRRERAAAVFSRAVEEDLTGVSEILEGMKLALVDEESIRTIDPDIATFWNLNSPEDMVAAEKRFSEQHHRE